VGTDKNVGAKKHPYKAIEKAQREVRKTTGEVVVYLGEGTYYLKSTIVFTTDDSRAKSEKLTYKAFDNEKVIISGAVPYKLNWKFFKWNLSC
jgi:hypothetical protein